MDTRCLEKWAKTLVHYSLKIRPGELVRISGTIPGIPLVAAIYREALLAGAHPYVHIAVDDAEETFYRFASDRQLEYVNPVDEVEVGLVHAYLDVRAPQNTRHLARVDPARVARRHASRYALTQRLNERVARGESRWCVTSYPTHAYAQDANMSLDEYEELIVRACFLDQADPVAAWKKVRERQERIIRVLQEHRMFRITAPGVDLTLSTEGRRWINGCGEFNFPDGEVFTGPVERSVNGYVRFNVPTVYRGRRVSGVELALEDGRVVKADAEEGRDLLLAMLDIDGGARYVGEFAFGLNYRLDRFTGDPYLDEKIGGTFHIALGRGYPETGSVTDSSLHWDMVYDLRQGEVYADGELVYAHGRFLFDAEPVLAAPPPRGTETWESVWLIT